MKLYFAADSFFQSDAFAIILIVGVALLAVAMTLTMVKVMTIEKNVARSRCRIVGQINIDPEKVDNPELVITIANRTLHHINIVSCGIFYDKKMINFIDKIRDSHDLTSKDRVFIPTNDSIEVRIPINKVRELVETGKRIHVIKVYAQDSLNNVTKANAVGVKKYILNLKRKEAEALKASLLAMAIEEKANLVTPEVPKEESKPKKEKASNEKVVVESEVVEEKAVENE